MSKINEIIKNIKSINGILNTQIESLNINIDDNYNSIIQKAQSDLISNICQDYNLNIKELSKKYLIKNKPGRKPKESSSNDSPTYQIIKTIKDELSEDNSDIDSLVKPIITDKKKTKKDKSPKNETEINDDNQLDEIIFKKITIKGEKYLLNPKSDIIFDFENNEVGKKKDDKYLMKKL